MIEKYQLSWRNQIAYTKSTIALTAIIVVIIACLYFSGMPMQEIKDVATTLGVLYIVQLILQIALHVNYYLVNKDDILEYDTVCRNVKFSHNNVDIFFNIDDIVLFTLYVSFPLYKNKAKFFAFDGYNHGIITLKDGTKVVITSLLLGGEIKLPISKFKTRTKLNIYRWAIGPSIQNSIRPRL